MDNRYKVVLYTIIICLLVVCLFSFFNQRNLLQTYRGELDSLKSQNISLKQERELLKWEISELQDSTFYYSSLVNEINAEVEKLKYRRDEKVDSIVDLPLDESVEFLSRYLSQSSSN